MGWNGSGGRATPPKPAPKKKPSALRGVAAGLVVVAVVAAGFFFLFSGDSGKVGVKESKKPTRIKEVTPAVASTNVAPAKPVDPREDYDHEKYYRDEKGILRYKTGCRAFDPLVKPKKVVNAAAFSKPLPFDNGCDIAIYSLISRRPGSLLGARRNYYSPELEAEYINSLVSPIRINPDDSERDKRRKQAVIDARKEIGERIRGGEKLGDILTQAANELRRLRDYRRNIEQEVGRMIEGGKLETADVEDVVKAANQLFDREGIAPLRADSFVKWNLYLTSGARGVDPDAAVREYEAKKAASADSPENQQGE